jgi:Baseplate J-like protein
MATKYEPLPNPTLDPRNERDLVELALTRTYERSRRSLNDFSPGSVLRVFAEMMAFTGAEALYYVNKLPFAFVIQFLQIFGIQRRLGSPSIVQLRFTLSRTLTEAYIIPSGTAVLSSDRKVKFLTNATLVIPIGQTFGTVAATCTTLGTTGNLPPYAVNQLLQSLPHLASVTNFDPATGGSNAETLKETQTRAMLALRRRGLISRDDYENKVRSILGSGSVALAKGNLAQDGISHLPGSVHVFALNADGGQPNSTQIAALKAQLLPHIQLGIELFVSPIDVRPVSVKAIARIVSGSNARAIADRIATQLRNYLKPGNLPPGEALLIDNLRYQMRLSGGVEYVEFLGVGESLSSVFSLNFPLKNFYSVAQVDAIELTLSDGRFSYPYRYQY